MEAITKEKRRKMKSLGGRKGGFYTENSQKGHADILSFRQKPVISVNFPG